MDNIQIAKQIIGAIDVNELPVSLKLRVVDALLELQRLERGTAPPKSEVIEDPAVYDSGPPPRWSSAHANWTVSAWFADVRTSGAIAGKQVGSGPVKVATDEVYRDYCDRGGLLGYTPLAINVFCRKLHASPRFLSRQRLRRTSPNDSPRSWVYTIDFR